MDVRFEFDSREELTRFIDQWWTTMDHLSAWNSTRPGASGDTREEGELRIPVDGKAFAVRYQLGKVKDGGGMSISLGGQKSYYLVLSGVPERFAFKMQELADRVGVACST